MSVAVRHALTCRDAKNGHAVILAAHSRPLDLLQELVVQEKGEKVSARARQEAIRRKKPKQLSLTLKADKGRKVAPWTHPQTMFEWPSGATDISPSARNTLDLLIDWLQYSAGEQECSSEVNEEASDCSF